MSDYDPWGAGWTTAFAMDAEMTVEELNRSPYPYPISGDEIATKRE